MFTQSKAGEKGHHSPLAEYGAYLAPVPRMAISDALAPPATIWRNPRDQINATLSSSWDNGQAVQWLEGGLRG